MMMQNIGFETLAVVGGMPEVVEAGTTFIVYDWDRWQEVMEAKVDKLYVLAADPHTPMVDLTVNVLVDEDRWDIHGSQQFPVSRFLELFFSDEL